jgi:dCTP deaminase
MAQGSGGQEQRMAVEGESLFPELEGVQRPAFGTGVLPCQALDGLIAAGQIAADGGIDADQIQPASLDLRLGAVAYRVRASFLPSGSSVRRKIETLGMHEIDLSSGAVLERGGVYIVPLKERLSLPAGLSASASPKSSTGRLDIFTRLIANYATVFDRVEERYKGELFLEISPRTFSVMVREGVRLNQLRFRRGQPPAADAELVRLHERNPLVFGEDSAPGIARIRKGLWISIDLKGVGESGLVGYRAKKHSGLIDLEKLGHYDPLEFWEPLAPTPARDLILNPDDFYILVSKERISVPPDFAAEMVAYDTSVGEFRIHYAGFFDPGFGYGGEASTGTRAVLEVRSHDVPFLLEDAQTVGRLVFERLTDVPERIYGSDIGSHYQAQELALAKQFKRG